MTILTELGNTIGRFGFSYIYDFQLDHFGITNTMGVNPTAADIKALQKASFVRITSNGVVENHPHDITISKKAPNYSK